MQEAPDCVRDLQSLGVRFDADRFGRLALGLEGGHSVRRVVHAGGSATGRRLVRQLSALAAADRRITVLEGARARALWTQDGRCRGLVCDGQVVVARRAVMLATGGAAALWARTTNPPGSQGIGLLLAHDAGAALADLELLQFHPTAVIGIRGREGFLVTEAIRGEGATLLDAAGERFVDELAPRDEVARAIQELLERTGERSVGLDMRAIDPATFPNVVAALREAGLDPTRELIPVAPAAHYMMGGIVTDLDAPLDRRGPLRRRRVLLHGTARRQPPGVELAERVLRVRSPGRRPTRSPARRPASSIPSDTETELLAALPAPPIAERSTREALWREAGIVRTEEGLQRLLADPHPLARLIARCALARTESRGAHLRADHPRARSRAGSPPRGRRRRGRLGWQTWR